MAQIQFDLENILANPNAKIMVAYGGSTAVEGFLVNDITIDGGNNFQNLLESTALNQLNETAIKAQSILGKTDAFSGIQFSTRMVEQTLDFWVSSERPVFSLDMVFVCLRAGQDVREKTLKLYQTVTPTYQNLGATASLTPPLGYLPKGLSADGTITVSIGRWFRASGQVMKRVSFKYSKQTTPDGLPLYAEGTIQFHPYREIEFRDLQGYLRGIG